MLNKNARRATWWTSPLVRNTVRAYPYFLLHYTLNKVLLSDRALHRPWEEAKPMEACIAHDLQTWSDCEGGLERALRMLRHCSWTVQKLDWRLDATNPYWSEVVGSLGAQTAA